MSYTSGIGGQQAANAISPSEAKPAKAVNASETAAGKPEGFSASVGHADETDLSSTGGLVLQSLGTSDTRIAKVTSLQEAIGAGSYTVSSADVADKIIASLLK